MNKGRCEELKTVLNPIFEKVCDGSNEVIGTHFVPAKRAEFLFKSILILLHIKYLPVQKDDFLDTKSL